MTLLAEQLKLFITGHPSIREYCLALSGGIDSTAMLHAMAALSPETKSDISFRAIHINHQLQSKADHWQRHCANLCQHYGIAYSTQTVDAQPNTRASPEAVARDARYRALESMLGKNECLLTAQHQNDQAETLLLQLLRGSGPAGLAAMPALATFGRGWIARPWLACMRKDIEEYARSNKLQWVDDDSNQQSDYARNYLRMHVLPAIAQRWPSYAKTLSRSARLQAEASQILEAMASRDLAQWMQADGALSVKGLAALSTTRWRNVVRHWLVAQDLSMPSEAQLEQIIQACKAPDDSAACVQWPQAEVRRHRNLLYALTPQASLPEQHIEWDLQTALHLFGVVLDRDALRAAGLNIDKAVDGLQIRFRQGGERIRLPGRKHHHKVKKLLQERQLKGWQRKRLPLLYYHDQLIAIWGLQPPIIAADWLLSSD